MFKVIAVYKAPASDEAKVKFDSYFRETHEPICMAIPGIRELRLNKIFGGPTGQSNLHLIAEMVFETKEAWKNAMKSPEMMSSGKDAMKFAGDLVSVHFAEETLHSAP
jgi:uncharacterized protein (TIGR02118 family)